MINSSKKLLFSKNYTKITGTGIKEYILKLKIKKY